MRKFLTTLALIAAVGSIAACADAPTAAPPAPEAPRDLFGIPILEPVTETLTGTLEQTTTAVGLPLVSTTLKRTTVLEKEVVASATIGYYGGTIALPGTGLRVEIPRGAISGDAVRITARAIPGRYVAYEFQPHGLRFAQPVRLSQELAGTQWLQTNPLLMKAVYFKDGSQLDALTGLVRVDEVLPATVDVLRGRVSFQVGHFSGYAVSTGRQAASTEEP